MTILSLEEIKAEAGAQGLSSAQVEQMRNRYGANLLTPPERDPLWKQYLEQFKDPIIQILLVAVVLSAAIALVEPLQKGHSIDISNMIDTLAIVAAVLLATGIAFINEYRSGKEFDILNAQKDMIPVKVIRDGHAHSIASKELVVADLIMIEAGDAIEADGWVIESDGLTVDEAAFTGESEPVKKKIEERVLKGSFATAGKGMVVSAAVGDKTSMGDIAASLGIEHDIQTPLEAKLETLAHQISTFGYTMAALIVAALVAKGVFFGDQELLNASGWMNKTKLILDYLMLAVVIIVVAVPEGLPTSVAMSLALAMRKMTRANSLVRKLIACETIGSATTICTDKTGTLTKNQMEVVRNSLAADDVLKDISGLPQSPAQWLVLNSGVNSTANLEQKEDKLVVIGNSTEGALLRWLDEAGIDYESMRKRFNVLHQNLFNSDRKRMSSVFRIDGKDVMLVKGAPEIIAELCVNKPDLAPVDVCANEAMRTLGFAHKIIDDGQDPETIEETGLTWDGFVAIRDNLRENVPEAVADCHKAGIKVRMVTGDNIATARAIARETGIYTGKLALTGAEFRALSDEELLKAVKDIEVLARAEPLDKLRLVQFLQKAGEVVAVTGDGTNDAPALKNADVGLSMGKTGTEVAREASDIVILDDSFPTIANAVWWGRALYENIQRFLQFQLTINIGACVLVFLAPLLGMPAPFTIIQLLWINIIMDTLAALALCSEAPYRGLLDKKPIPKNANIITKSMWFNIISMGGIYVVAGLWLYHSLLLQFGWTPGSSEAPLVAKTLFFTTFVLAQVFNGLNSRAVEGRMPPLLTGNPVFFGVMSVIVILQLLIVQFGGSVFATTVLTSDQWRTAIWYALPVLVIGILLMTVNGMLFRRSQTAAD